MTGVLGSAATTRQRLIESTAGLMAEGGFDAAGVQEIAARAGFTTGAIYRQFGSRDRLILDTIRYLLDESLSEAEPVANVDDRTPAKLRVAYLTGTRLSAGNKTEVMRRVLLEALMTARRSEELQRDVQHFFTTKHETTVDLLQEAVDAGVIDPEVDVNALALYSTVVACGL